MTDKPNLYPAFYRDFAQPAMLALARAGNRGCLIDVPLRRTFAESARARVAEAQAVLDAAVGSELNCNSPKQVKALLYDRLKLPEQYKFTGKKRSVSSDNEAISKLQRSYPEHDTVLSAILGVRQGLKEAQQHEVKLEQRPEGEVFPTSYNATGTKTGRISSSATLLGFGDNLQNRKRGPSRKCFRARPGMIFVKADGSQAEARVVAALCRDTALLERFADPGFDIHAENAAMIYHVTEAEVQAQAKEYKAAGRGDSWRQRTKGITHGANYQGGPKVAVKQADIPFAEAKMAIAAYRRSRPLMLSWWDRVEETVILTRRIRTCWGRLRVFFKRIDARCLREATAQEPQSTVGDLINHAFFRLDESLASLGAYPLLQAHDEIVCEAPLGTEDEVATLLQAEMQFPLPMETGPLVIPAEVQIGPNWGELEAWSG